jgi:SnoaL-like domain
LASLEDRVRKLEDRAALQDLVTTYFRATDDDDYETLEACFAPDARFAASGFDGGGGRDGVIAFLKTARAGMGQTVHTPNYVQLDFKDDDTATGVVGAHLELGIGGQTIYAAVRYLDEYARIDGRWFIKSREMKAIHVGPWSDVGTSLSTPLNVRWPGGEAGPSDFPRHSIK